MIGGGRIGRITAVVSGNHHHIVIAQCFHKLTQPGIELREGVCIAVDIPAVSELHIKVHQIHKAKACKILLCKMIRMRHTVLVGLVINIFRQADARENIVNFSHADGGKAGIFHCLGQRNSRRLQRKVVAVGSALEAARLTHKGAGNHAAYAVLTL